MAPGIADFGVGIASGVLIETIKEIWALCQVQCLDCAHCWRAPNPASLTITLASQAQ